MRDAGFYTLFLREGNPLGTYAFNYDRRESALDYYAPDALRERVGAQANIINIADTAVLTARIEEQSQGTPLWRWCLILALAFLAGEVLLLRLWKV